MRRLAVAQAASTPSGLPPFGRSRCPPTGEIQVSYPVGVMCRMFGVNRTTAFMTGESRVPSDRALSDAFCPRGSSRSIRTAGRVWGAADPRRAAARAWDRDGAPSSGQCCRGSARSAAMSYRLLSGRKWGSRPDREGEPMRRVAVRGFRNEPSSPPVRSRPTAGAGGLTCGMGTSVGLPPWRRKHDAHRRRTDGRRCDGPGR